VLLLHSKTTTDFLSTVIAKNAFYYLTGLEDSPHDPSIVEEWRELAIVQPAESRASAETTTARTRAEGGIDIW